jgi:CheY-like chemotaxis protein
VTRRSHLIGLQPPLTPLCPDVAINLLEVESLLCLGAQSKQLGNSLIGKGDSQITHAGDTRAFPNCFPRDIWLNVTFGPICDEADFRPITMKPRLLLADDHPSLLEAATILLKPHFELVGVATDGAMLISEVLRVRPEVVVTDITLPIVTGLDAVIQLRKLGSSAKVVFLTVHSEEELLKACMAEGASGYVQKVRMKAHLIPAIRAVLEGRSYISPFAAI